MTRVSSLAKSNVYEESENAGMEKEAPATAKTTTEANSSLVESVRQLEDYITKLTNNHTDEIVY
jgi:hypothetical protein